MYKAIKENKWNETGLKEEFANVIAKLKDLKYE